MDGTEERTTGMPQLQIKELALGVATSGMVRSGTVRSVGARTGRVRLGKDSGKARCGCAWSGLVEPDVAGYSVAWYGEGKVRLNRKLRAGMASLFGEGL